MKKIRFAAIAGVLASLGLLSSACYENKGDEGELEPDEGQTSPDDTERTGSPNQFTDPDQGQRGPGDDQSGTDQSGSDQGEQIDEDTAPLVGDDLQCRVRGEYCRRDRQCCSGDCRGNICRGGWGGGGGEFECRVRGEYCYRDSQCCSGNCWRHECRGRWGGHDDWERD